VGVACVAFTSLGWGLNWPVTKLLIAACPPLSARGTSGVVACLILCGIALAGKESLKVSRESWPRLAMAALLNVTFWMGGTTASLQWLRAGPAATLAYTMPIWVCLLAWPLLGERPSIRQACAIVLGICGVLALLGLDSLSFVRADWPGVGLALLAATLFAFSTVYGKAHPIALSPIALTAWQVGLGSIPLLVLGGLLERPDFMSMPPFAWAALCYTALISMGFGYVTWFMATRRLPAPAAAMGTLLTPVVGVVASSLALGDPLTLRQIMALALVGMGILLTVRTR
jgi:drug/metabolite transporter (DMT)-like permease